jgi:hypothetical protein
MLAAATGDHFSSFCKLYSCMRILVHVIARHRDRAFSLDELDLENTKCDPQDTLAVASFCREMQDSP